MSASFLKTTMAKCNNLTQKKQYLMDNTLVEMMSNFIELTDDEKQGILEAFAKIVQMDSGLELKVMVFFSSIQTKKF